MWKMIASSIRSQKMKEILIAQPPLVQTGRQRREARTMPMPSRPTPSSASEAGSAAGTTSAETLKLMIDPAPSVTMICSVSENGVPSNAMARLLELAPTLFDCVMSETIVAVVWPASQVFNNAPVQANDENRLTGDPWTTVPLMLL